MNNLFCCVHPIDSFAKGVDRDVKEYELQNDVGATQTYSHRSSSAVQALVHVTVKAYHKEGSGVPQELKVYLNYRALFTILLGSAFTCTSTIEGLSITWHPFSWNYSKIFSRTEYLLNENW